MPHERSRMHGYFKYFTDCIQACLVSSSNGSLVSPMIFLNYIVVDMTTASYKPLKCGDLSGVNFTVCSVDDTESVTLSWLFDFVMNSYKDFNSGSTIKVRAIVTELVRLFPFRD